MDHQPTSVWVSWGMSPKMVGQVEISKRVRLASRIVHPDKHQGHPEIQEWCGNRMRMLNHMRTSPSPVCRRTPWIAGAPDGVALPCTEASHTTPRTHPPQRLARWCTGNLGEDDIGAFYFFHFGAFYFYFSNSDAFGLFSEPGDVDFGAFYFYFSNFNGFGAFYFFSAQGDGEFGAFYFFSERRQSQRGLPRAMLALRRI